MQENEIKMVITALDNASAVMKQVGKNTQTMAKDTEKANQSLSQSFSKVQGAMLNLGQVAQGIHNIFEISEARTRKLENAQDRLENATIRLKQSQEDLLDVQRSHKKNLLGVEKATIANRRAQEDLKYFTDQTAKGVRFFGEKLKDFEDAQIRAKEAALDLSDAEQVVTDESRKLKDAQDAVTIANNKVEAATRTMNKVIGDSKWAYVDMGMQAVSTAGNLGTFLTSTGLLKTGLSGLGGTIGTATAGTAFAGLGVVGLLAGLGIALVAIDTYSAKQQVADLTAEFSFLGYTVNQETIPALIRYQKKVDSMGQTSSNFNAKNNMKNVNEGLAGWQAANPGVNVVTGKLNNPYTISSTPTTISSSIANLANTNKKITGGTTTRFNDFIQRPGQAPISFSADDTIVGTKGGLGGTTINITGNIYGVNADDISNAIMKQLKTKISI